MTLSKSETAGTRHDKRIVISSPCFLLNGSQRNIPHIQLGNYPQQRTTDFVKCKPLNHRGDISNIARSLAWSNLYTRIESWAWQQTVYCSIINTNTVDKKLYITWLPGLSCFHWTGPRFFWISNPKTLINSSSLCHPGMCGWGFPKPENHQTEVWLANVLMEIRPEISYAQISTTSMKHQQCGKGEKHQKPLSCLLK